MHYITVALLIVTASVRSDQLQAYRQHEALVKRYPCSAPQPRVFELEEVIGMEVLNEKVNGDLRLIKPAVTVLHRCHLSGCCQNRLEKCQPFDTEDVKLVFSISGSRLSYLEVDAVNHTRCACTTI